MIRRYVCINCGRGYLGEDTDLMHCTCFVCHGQLVRDSKREG